MGIVQRLDSVNVTKDGWVRHVRLPRVRMRAMVEVNVILLLVNVNAMICGLVSDVKFVSTNVRKIATLQTNKEHASSRTMEVMYVNAARSPPRQT
jgi:hypothetical protein